MESCIESYRIELLTGTVLVDKEFLVNPLLPGTVPVNNFLLTGTHPISELQYKELLTGTVPVNK